MGNLNIISASGTGQDTAALISAEGQIFTVDVLNVPSGSGVRLHGDAYNFAACLVRNSGSNALLVYPPPNGTIDRSLSPTSVDPGNLLELWAFSRLDWVSVAGSSVAPPSYVAPAFTSFAISGQATTLEVGDSVASGSRTFTWATSTPANVATNSISIVDTTASATLASSLGNDGSQAVTISSITHTSPATQTWTINGTDTQSAGFSRTFSVSWDWRAHWGNSANTTLTGSQILALTSSGLQTASAGSYSEGATGYKYLAFPTTLTQPTSVKDQLTNFNVPMADTSPYTNVNPSGLNYAVVSVTNAFSVTQNYALYRTKNASASSVTLVVS